MVCTRGCWNLVSVNASETHTVRLSVQSLSYILGLVVVLCAWASTYVYGLQCVCVYTMWSGDHIQIYKHALLVFNHSKILKFQDSLISFIISILVFSYGRNLTFNTVVDFTSVKSVHEDISRNVYIINIGFVRKVVEVWLNFTILSKSIIYLQVTMFKQSTQYKTTNKNG